MQINRLFEIVYILLDKKTVTAKELAEKFEVSIRTIYRDIDSLCAAGIPIYTTQGKGGGICLMDNFILNKSVLSEKEQDEILIALQSLNVTNFLSSEDLLSKLCTLFNKKDCNWIEVDLSHWGNDEESKKRFSLLKSSILNSNIITFDYFSSYGEKTSRRVEPLQLWFKDKSWYLKAYCVLKQDFRTFKLTRIKNLKILEENFTRTLPPSFCNDLSDKYIPKMVTLKLHFSPYIAYRIYDEFDENHIIKNQDGSFSVTNTYPYGEWIYEYIMSFGNHVKVIEPDYVAKIIMDKLKSTLNNYL